MIEAAREEKQMDLGKIVADRLVRLKGLDSTALESLPPHTTEALTSKVTVTQYHEAHWTGKRKVVVQASRSRWLGTLDDVEVDGFVVAPDGTRRPLTEEEKWPYL
jgi:hypothetical protein